MPPKKKDADQQAKKLEQQRKKKQEQEARLELERKKYLSETLSTGLLLPASVQLIVDFPHKSLEFMSDKLKDAIKHAYPQVIKSSRLKFVLKELHYFIKDSYSLFGEVQEGSNVSKHRIFVAIMLTILLNNDHEANGKQKNRADDERKIKQLVTVHCNKIEEFEHLSKNDGLAILNYAKETYFARFQLIRLFDKFPKKHTETSIPIYIETPNYYFNNETTPFTDLSKKDEQPQENKV